MDDALLLAVSDYLKKITILKETKKKDLLNVG